jgi:pentatricopeptide repeat protein
MVIKPFTHLARYGFTKSLFHGSAQSVIAASQSSYASTTTSLAQFHNYPVTKFAKASQLQSVFPGASSSGAGAKAGHAAHSSNADGGLGLYYAAWQHAQQTGDDSDWKQHQFARRIGWKSSERSSQSRTRRRLDSNNPIDVLRPVRPSSDRGCSDNAVQDLKKAQDPDSQAEPEALVRDGEAIAQEMQSVEELNGSSTTSHDAMHTACAILDSSSSVEPSAQAQTEPVTDTNSISSSPDKSIYSNATGLTSPITDDSYSISSRVIKLAEQQRYAEIPAIFESMLRDNLIPSTDAYNALLIAAIQLTSGIYQAWPKALEVYSDMTRRSVTPNETTYAILIQFLIARGAEAIATQNSLALRRTRFGSLDGSFVFKSSDLEHELFAGDNSLTFAIKLYKKAKSSFPYFALPLPAYASMVEACAETGLAAEMMAIFSDMKALQVSPNPTFFYPMIQAFASTGDLNAANQCYAEYRSLAIARPTSDVQHDLDMEIYAALIKAYFTCGHKEAGLRFYEKILQSYENAVDASTLTKAMQSHFVLRASLQHLIETKDFADALGKVKTWKLSETTKSQALNKLCIAAADADETITAHNAYDMINPEEVSLAAAVGMVASYTRRGLMTEAKPFWNVVKSSEATEPFMTDLTTMYASALIQQGTIEEGLHEARTMFARLREANASRAKAIEEIDEAIVLFGETLTEKHAVITPQASLTLLRTMIENGGLVSPVAEHAIASLGPECVLQLNYQDIALALHVQAGMLSGHRDVSDPAHAARFSHLLETVLNCSIPMDPSTVSVISEALPKLNGSRPDLLQRWHEFMEPVSPVEIAPAILSPVVPQSPSVKVQPISDTYDPYAYNTDYRASTIIADQLESTTGRPETHLQDALSRFRNVRRAGRHPRYNTYAKLITAAGKTKQATLIHEILGLAQADVPYLPDFPMVKAGWIPILDAMVAACLTIGDRQLAAKYHQDLLDMGASPSANTFGIYITTLEGTLDEATEAVKIFQRALSEGVEPGVFLYNAVIGKLGKARRIDDCLFYFGDMQSRNIRPSSVTYGTLVNALCRTSEERFAEEMFDEMESMPNYRPRAAPYNCIIQYFLNTKRDRSKVLAYFERMKARNIKPTSHTYKLLIESYATLEPIDLSAAEAILSDIRASGMLPEAVHYGSLIHAKGCVMHDMAAARAIFDSVLSDGTVRPTDTLYQNLFEAMVANHQVGDTSKLLEDMAARNVPLTPYIANTLIHGWAAEGNVDRAKAIYDSLGVSKREPSTYEAMTRAFLSAEDHQNASKVVQAMLQKGYPSAVAEKVLLLVSGSAS